MEESTPNRRYDGPVKLVPVPKDIEIAQAAPILPILEIARRAGLTEDDLDLFGKYKAKVHLDVRERLAGRPNGKYIDVTAITPTPLGEGKTVTTIGLSQALHWTRRVHLSAPTEHGPDFWHQRRRGRWRLCAGDPDGGL
jgi:hypothetical protein